MIPYAKRAEERLSSKALLCSVSNVLSKRLGEITRYLPGAAFAL